ILFGQGFLDRLVTPRNGGREAVYLPQQLPQQEALCPPQLSGTSQRCLQLFSLGSFAHLLVSHPHQHISISLPSQHSFYDGTPRNSQYIRKHVTQLDACPFQHLVYSVGKSGAGSDEVGPLPHQLPQVPLSLRGDEGGSDQSMPQQVGYPLGIFDIGLTPRYRLDVLGVEQPHLE